MIGKIYKHKRTCEKIEVIGKGEFWVIYKVLTLRNVSMIAALIISYQKFG